MGKLAVVFAGQGAQHPGMGRSIYEASPAAKAVLDMAEAAAPGTLDLCFAGTPEQLRETKNTQPCLYAVDLACAQALVAQGIHPQCVAGFSLGELAAAAFAGIFSHSQGFTLVQQRAIHMDACAQRTKGGMAAVLRLDTRQVEDICSQLMGTYPVNYNCPGQTVVAFCQDSLEPLTAAVAAQKGRVLPLEVSGAFHSPYMDAAAGELGKLLADMPLQQPRLPIYANLTGRLYCGSDLVDTLAGQINHPVQWQKTIEGMVAEGFDCFIEVGPGKTLAGLIKKIAPQVQVCNVFDAASLEETIATISIKGMVTGC